MVLEAMNLEKELKKGIGKLKIGLVISGIVIVALAGLNIWFYLNKHSLEVQIGELWDNYGHEQWWHSYYQNMSNQLSTEKDALQSAYNNYVAIHNHTNSEYDALESERGSLKAPKLTILSVFVDDVRPFLGNPYLHVYGDVWNVGTDTAYNSRLHVMAYQGAVLAVDTYIELGTIYGENKKHMDERIYYVGGALTSWYIFSLWN